jgi:hypothetical protein
MNDIGIVFVFLFVMAVIAIASFAWRTSRSQTIIDRWAAANGFRVLSAEQRFLRTGPFFFRHDKRQTVYHVTVQDSTGRTRSGYIRCGGWFAGLLSDTARVEWDD